MNRDLFVFDKYCNALTTRAFFPEFLSAWHSTQHWRKPFVNNDEPFVSSIPKEFQSNWGYF